MNAWNNLEPKAPPVTPDDFVRAMGAAATSVSVVTTAGLGGRFGLTVSALSSVSAEPPLLLVCVNRKNPSVSAITQNGRFAVNILATHQQDVARVFSGRPLDGQPYDFARHSWIDSENGLPLLQGAAANFECETETIHDAGTHRIFIGRVFTAIRSESAPLIYSNRNFGRMADLDGGK
ncbi:MAG: flavin reductase family protein [Proteobacteria bacterium]|nr:flavin reductase family protein [Pseudomonadota bacterium]